jgi:hypothetical protein
MTKYNPKYLLPNNKGGTGLNWTTKGNSEVSYWKPDNRVPDTTRYWQVKLLNSGASDLGFYATGAGVHVFASYGQSPNGKYITSPSYGAATDSWTLRNTPNTDGGTTGLFFINNVFYLISFGNGGGNNGYIYTSPDAVTWTLRRTGNFGGHLGISGWYNPGLGRNEVCVVGVGMGNPYALGSIDNGVTWTSTSGGWASSTSLGFIKPDLSAQNKFVMGTRAGGLWEVFYAPGSTITSVAASPLGAVELCAFERASIGPGTNYFYLATTTNVLAVQSGAYNSSWTIINSPAASGDYVVDMRTRNSGIGQVVLIVATRQGKIYAGAPTLTNIYWQDISPNPLNNQVDTVVPTYKFIYNGQIVTNDIGIAPRGNNFTGITAAMTTQNVVRGILSTNVF